MIDDMTSNKCIIFIQYQFNQSFTDDTTKSTAGATKITTTTRISNYNNSNSSTIVLPSSTLELNGPLSCSSNELQQKLRLPIQSTSSAEVLQPSLPSTTIIATNTSATNNIIVSASNTSIVTTTLGTMTTATLTTIATTNTTATTTTSTTMTTTATITTTTINTNERSKTDSSGRSAALERAYVHDVYENCEETVGPIRPRVAQFLTNLDPGSLVCDVGCGNGRYLNSCNPLIYTIGIDRCYRLTKISKNKGGEVNIN